MANLGPQQKKAGHHSFKYCHLMSEVPIVYVSATFLFAKTATWQLQHTVYARCGGLRRRNEFCQRYGAVKYTSLGVKQCWFKVKGMHGAARTESF